MIELRVIPGHDERDGSAGTSAGGGAAFGVAGELDMIARLDLREDFLLDKFRVAAGHGVVLEAALAALGVAGAVGDRDGDHDGYAMLGDE